MPTNRQNQAANVARWMLQEFLRNNCRLNQAKAFKQIQEQFGDEFVDTHSERHSIARSVLEEFKELTGDTVVWDMNEGGWRRREAKDPAGTRHAYE